MATNKQIEEAWNNAHKMSDMGWEVDHRHPVSKGGTDSSRNLQAVQWEENRSKSNKYPYKSNK